MPPQAQKSKKGNKHATNSHRRDRKYGKERAKVAKAGRRAARFTPPPKPNGTKSRGTAAGEKQFFSPGVPNILAETVTLASGDTVTKYIPIFGKYDATRKRWIRNIKEFDK